MLKELQVRQLALVEHARVRFGPGLNLLTGETGSGKSLIVDALGLALGARASTDQVRQGAERATVEAMFEASDVPAALLALESMGHVPAPDLLLMREVGRRGAARVNGRLASPAQLRELGRALVAVHGQHEHHLLLEADSQTRLLDAFADALRAREAVGAAHAEWIAATARLADLERMQARGEREEEYLRWQLEELTAANLRLGEDEELLAERGVARHASRLAELVEEALAAVRHDEGLGAAAAQVGAAAELDARLAGAAERLGVLEAEAADLGAELRRYREALDLDPRRLEAIEGRLAALEQVKRKYGGSLEAAVAELERLQSRLAQTADLGAAVEATAGRVTETRIGLEVAAADLSRLRAEGARRLATAVGEELAGLRLEGAVFEVRLRPRPDFSPDGAEEVEMAFSGNPGEAPAPLVRVVSGGELSRVMLAIRAAGAQADRLPTLVFDEVDAGIGGEAAIQVGLRLKRLGAQHQVLVVTHLAQIACFADHHLVVEKSPGADGRNVIGVRELESQEERAAELARMMSGRVTDKALARARELLEEGQARSAAA